jgi:hypothetical protein
MSNDPEFDVFVSYARGDREVVRPAYKLMVERDWRVFWDADIPTQAQWESVLLNRLQAARCIVVFWSRHASASQWVLREAEFGLAAKKLLQAQLEVCDIPAAFADAQIEQLNDWRGSDDHAGLRKLLAAVRHIVRPGYQRLTLPSPRRDEDVTEDHLALVHSSWRRPDKDAQFGGRPLYQIHLMLLGQPETLKRVGKVTYRLDDAYPPQHRERERTNRAQNFGFYELANGYSVVVAIVAVLGQDRPVRLTRFVNLTVSGPNLKEEFVMDYRLRSKT